MRDAELDRCIFDVIRQYQKGLHLEGVVALLAEDFYEREAVIRRLRQLVIAKAIEVDNKFIYKIKKEKYDGC